MNEKEKADRARAAVRPLLVLSPAMFVLSYVLAAVQGAIWQHSLVIAIIGTLGCLGAALVLHLRGSKAAGDLIWIQLIIRLFARR